MTYAPFDLGVGDTVAGYRVERIVGRGGSATVYEARHQAPPRPELAVPVALKVMHEHDASGVGKQRFEREAALTQKFNHPNVVRLLDFGYTEREWPFIAFELLRGMPLKNAIRKRGPFDVATTVKITLEILAALAAAHDMGIVHRDIKPGNVFLQQTDAGDVVQVLDLGLAKALFGDGLEVQTLTGTGSRLGTPRYMSPEMARGEKVGREGDLYAVALLMAEMIVGRPVVKAKSQVELLLAHSSEEPLPLDEAVCSSPLHAVILRGLAKDVQVRYHTAMQMRADVEAALMLYERLPAFAAAQASFSPDMAPTMVYGNDPPEPAPSGAGELGGTLVMEEGLPPSVDLPEASTEKMQLETVRLLAAKARAEIAGASEPVPVSAPAPWAQLPPPEVPMRRSGIWWLLIFVVLALAFAVGGYYLAG